MTERRGLLLVLLAVLGWALAGCRPPAAAEPRARPLLFRDVAREMGLEYRFSHGGTPPLNILELMGAGVAFLDFDSDGWLDILCVSLPRPALFRNIEGRRFEDVTEQAGLGVLRGRWFGCATGDYDNDGHPDVFLTGYETTALLHNTGKGRFDDVTDRMGARERFWASSASFGDIERDGFLDLYVGAYLVFRPGMPEFKTMSGVPLTLGPGAYEPQKGVLLKNEEGRRFRDATRATGTDATHGKTLGVAFADPDNDGDDDLYLANDQLPQDFFENDGRGHFRNVAVDNGTAYRDEARVQSGMGVDFGDYDGDGWLDLFVTNFSDEPKSLYRNLGNGLYELTGNRAGVAQSTRSRVGFGTKFVDLNNDGWLDLVLVSGHVQDLIQRVDPGSSYPQRSQMFLNLGDGRFREISDEVGEDFRRPIVGRGLAAGDFDNDGDVDLLAADLEGAPVLWRNEGGPDRGNWLSVQLTGSRSNRMAIGARLELRVGDRVLVRELRTDGSYLAAHDPRVHFGLGRASRAEELRIRWPSGRRQILRDLPANRWLRLTEPL